MGDRLKLRAAAADQFDVSVSAPDSTQSARTGVLTLVAATVVSVAVLLLLAVVTGGILVPSIVALAALVVPSVGALRTRGSNADTGSDEPAAKSRFKSKSKPAAQAAPAAAKPAPAPVAAVSKPDAHVADPPAAPDVEPVVSLGASAEAAAILASIALPEAPASAAPFADAAVLDPPAARHSGEVRHLDDRQEDSEATTDIEQRTILLVDDEDALRRFCARILERAGFTVVQARTGPDALALVESGSGVDLLLTDVVMPQMSGRELAQRLVNAQPDLKVIYVSGYADDTILRHGIEREGVAFLQKPFKSGELLDAVNGVFGG